MKQSSSLQGRRKIFLWIVLGCLALAVGYTARGILRAGAGGVQAQGGPLTTAEPGKLAAIQSGPHLLFLHQAEPPYGQVSLTGLDADSPQGVQTALRCDRIYYDAGNGICLMYDTSAAASDPLAPPQVQVALFGSDFQPRHQFTVEGIPSRTRISPDGK
jgi:hypothetical protein